VPVSVAVPLPLSTSDRPGGRVPTPVMAATGLALVVMVYVIAPTGKVTVDFDLKTGAVGRLPRDDAWAGAAATNAMVEPSTVSVASATIT